MTSGSKAKGRFVKQDFVYLAEEDVYRCPAGERLTYHYTNVEKGLMYSPRFIYHFLIESRAPVGVCSKPDAGGCGCTVSARFR